MSMETVANKNDSSSNNGCLQQDVGDQDWILEKSISILALDQADRRVLKVADQRDTVQKKTFTKWINFYLSKNDLHVTDLYVDLRDGHLLLSLLEIFTNQTISRERGTSKFHALRNIERCLQCLEQDHGIRLVNIRPEELVNGNPKLTLGLIWRIILHFQFSDVSLQSLDENSVPNAQPTTLTITGDESSKEPTPTKRLSRNISIEQVPLNYRSMLLVWARQQCQDYAGIYVDDFTHSWRNGRAFLAILHRHNPSLINIKQAYFRSNRENLELAFQFAQERYGIAQLIDPEDVDTDEPDEKSILLYIAYLYKACPTLPNHPLKQEHDRIRLEGELSSRYAILANDFLRWIKMKLDILNREVKFKNFEEFRTFESILQTLKHDDISAYNQLLYQLRAIDAEFRSLNLHELLQPDIDSINLAWNKLKENIRRIEDDLNKYKKLIIDLDLIENDIRNIEIKSKQCDNHATINYFNEMQVKLDRILKYCQTLVLSNEQTQDLHERISQLNLRINVHQTLPSTKANGFPQLLKQQTHFSPSMNMDKLNVIITREFTHDSLSFDENILIEELRLIDSNLHILDQLLQTRTTYLLQNDLSTTNDDLAALYKHHKEFENHLLSQASRINDIRNHIRQESQTISHQELRSLVNQTTDHVQNIFTASKTYSEKIVIVERALNLINELTSQTIEIETRLISQALLIDDENYFHRHLNELNELHTHAQALEKSASELLMQSNNIGNDVLIRTSEHLITRSKQTISEIIQRKRSIKQIIESYRSFQTLFDQNERVLQQIEKRIQSLEPIPNDLNKLQRLSKTVTDLFHNILSRSQSVEHLNDVAVKFIQETKMYEKNLKHFRTTLNNSLNLPISTKQQPYPSNIQNAYQSVLNRIEEFDRRYANLLAHVEEYARSFMKNYNTTGQTINLPVDSASSIVHLYRSTIASRYNTVESLLSSSNDDEHSSASLSTRKNSHETGFIDLPYEKVTVDQRHHHHHSLSSLDGSVSFETTYVIPPDELSSSLPSELDNDQSKDKTVKFIIQKQQQPTTSTIIKSNVIMTSSKSNDMTQRKNLSFLDAVNSKYLDLSTGFFSSPLPFALSSPSSSSFSSSTSPLDQHRYPHNHFSSISSSSPPYTTTTTTNSKKLLSTSPLSVNNRPFSVGADSTTTTNNTTTTITLKEAIETNILDSRSAYVIDTVEQRNYDLREAYSRGLINPNNHHIIDRAASQEFSLGEALKMGILKVGDSHSYNVISKTESLVISSVFDHRLNTFVDPNVAIRTKILDPYHGVYLNNLTQESLSIDDAMTKGFIIVEQQQPSNHNHHADKYVISTSLIRETRSYHLLGVRDYIYNKELSVQEAIRLGILDKQNGQYINRKTNEILSISEAIAQGHIRAQPLPVEATANQETVVTNKRGTVKETKTYTLKSAIHPKTQQEIPIRLAIDEGIIDHARGFYVNNVTGENLPISVAIERGLIFTELIDQRSRRSIKTLIIEQVIDPVTNRRLTVNEAIKTGLLNSSITSYYHSVTQKQMSLIDAYEQGLIIGKFRDHHPSSFYGDQHEQVFYLITGITDIRTDKVYSLQEGIQQNLFDHKKGVYIHPITNDEINIGDAVKRGFIQVQAVSSQVVFSNTDQISTDKRRTIISQEPYGNGNDSRSKLSIRIESQAHPRTPYEINESESLQHDKDVVEIESIQRLPRQKKSHIITREEEIIEQHTKNVVDREVYINRNGNGRARSKERPRQQYIEEVIIDDGIQSNRRAKFDIKEDRHTTHREIVIEGDRYMPPPLPPKDHLVINGTKREHEVRVVSATRPPKAPSPPRAIHIDDHQREGQRIHHGELIIDDHERPYTSVSSQTATTTTKEYIDITDNHPIKTSPIQKQQTTDYVYDEQQSWTEEEWEQWHCIMMIKGQPYRVVWVMNTATCDRLPLQNAYQRGLVDTKQRLFFDEKLNRQPYSFERAVELGYMGIEPDTASLPMNVDGIDYMIHWVLDASTKRRIFPRQAVRKQILDPVNGRYINPYNKSQVSLHEAVYLKFVGATEYNTTSDSMTIIVNGQPYNMKWVYDTRTMKKLTPRDALKLGILDIQLNEYRKFDTNDIMTIYDAIQAGYIRCNDDESSSDNSVRPPSIVSIDEDELTIATKTATYVITSVIHPLTQKEIKVSEAIDLGILDKDIGSYRDLVTNVQYELAEAINEGLVYATIIETKEDTEMLTSSVQEIVKKFIVKSVAVDSESQEKIGGLEAQAIGILNYAQGVYHDRKYGVKIPLDKAIERKLLDVELISQKRFEEYDLEVITDTITEKRIILYRIRGVRNNVLDRMESGAVAVKNQIIDTEAKTYTDFSTGETMTIQEAINRGLIEAEINENVERKPLGLSLQNAIRLGFYVAETGTFRDPATEQYMTLMEAIERGHIHVNGIAFADSEQGPITLYDAFSLGLINRRDGGKLNPAKIGLYRARLVESKLHRMNVEDAIRLGLLSLRTGLYKHPHSGEQLNLKEAIHRGLIDGQSTIIEHPSTERFMTLKDALDGIRIDNEGQVIDSHTNKVITTLELAFNHRKLFSQFDVNAGEVFLPSLNEAVGFEKAIRKSLLDNNRMKLFDPKTSREYTIQDAMERGLVDSESGLIYDTHTRTQYSIREAIRHGIVAIVGAPLVPIKANHDTVAAKITSRKHRRHSLAKSSLHFDYNSAPDSADEDSQGSGWHRIKSRARAISPISFDGRSDSKYNGRRRTGSSPTRTCRDDDWRTKWNGSNRKDDDDDDDRTLGSTNMKHFGGNSLYTNVTTRVQQSSSSSNQSHGRQTSSNVQQKREKQSSPPSAVSPKVPTITNGNENRDFDESTETINDTSSSTKVSHDEHVLSIAADNNADPLQALISSESISKTRDDEENRLIFDMNDVAGRLTFSHSQLNQYVYLTENLAELRENVEQIKKLHVNIENEKSVISNLIERATHTNHQLAVLTKDLEDKRMEISDINVGLCSIIERFIAQFEQFVCKHTYITKWLKTNEKEIDYNLHLSTLSNDNDKFKNILQQAISLQNELTSFQGHLQTIDSVIQEFQQATENTDGGKSAMILHELQQQSELLSINYLDFVKRCKQISDLCERHSLLFNEINQLDQELIKSMNEFDQQLSISEKNQQIGNTLQSLLLSVQQQLDKLRMLLIYEPTSLCVIPVTNNHIQRQIKEHLCKLIDTHTVRYDDAHKRLMHHFELIERILHERQTIKERINELYHWLLCSVENDFFAKPLSLKRSKLDEQIISFRQFHAQLLTRQYSFRTDINTQINFEQLFDDDDKNSIKLIDEYFQTLNEKSEQYNEHINNLSRCLNEFHLEHTHLVDTYANSLLLYVNQIKQNNDLNFSTLELLLNNSEDSSIDHTLYDQLIDNLLQTSNIEDQNILMAYKNDVVEHKKQYERLRQDLKLILQNRQVLLNQYEIFKTQIEECLLKIDRALKQILTLNECQQLLVDHENLPIEQLKLLSEQLINFYSSPNLLSLYELLKLSKPINHSNTALSFQKQTNNLVENYELIRQRILQYISSLEAIQQQHSQYQSMKQKAEMAVEEAKQLIHLNETIMLPLDSQKIAVMLQKYKDIREQMKSMSDTIEEYKTVGMTLIDMAQRYTDMNYIEDEINSLAKSWSEYVEYVFDTIDYIQLHQEDLNEFYQLARSLLVVLDEKAKQYETIDGNDDQSKLFYSDIEQLNNQVLSINQKGGILLQGSIIAPNDNEVECLLDLINRSYENLTARTKVSLENININETHESTTTDHASAASSKQLVDEIYRQIDDINVGMNDLSELLVSSTADPISAQPMKLNDQLSENNVVHNELNKQKDLLQLLFSNVQMIKETIVNAEELNLITVLTEKMSLLNHHWLIMKQTNDLRQENLVLAQLCANQFWSEYTDLTTCLDGISKQLIQIRPRSTSRQYLEHELAKYNGLEKEFSNAEVKFHEILQVYASQLRTLISSNQQEIDDIERCLCKLEQECNRIKADLVTCQQELSDSMIKSEDLNNKLENVTTWIDEKALLAKNIECDHKLESIRTFKEHLDDKYIDIINIKQEYIDMELENEDLASEKSNIVEHQLEEVDSKWTQLKEKLQEQKTLIYETALRQNHIGDIISDINQSLDACTVKLSVLNENSSNIDFNDAKHIEIFIAKFRILLNDIELISYDIEQLKHGNYEDKDALQSINNRWEELLTQTNEKYNLFDSKLQGLKLRQKRFEHYYHELNSIDQQVHESTLHSRFPSVIERLEHIEDLIQKDFMDDDSDQIKGLKQHLTEVKQRTIRKGQEILELRQSVEHFNASLKRFTDYLNECDRHLNALKPIHRRFALLQTLSKQIDDHKSFQNRLEIYKEHFMDLDKLAIHLKYVLPKNDSIYVRNSLVSVQTRWHNILMRTNEKMKEFEKAAETAKKMNQPLVTDIDRIKNEVNRQTSLCQCSKKYDVEQIAEGRYRFGESQSLRLVRILRSTVMVRVGGGWTALDEFLVRHDPCRGYSYHMAEANINDPKGRTNYELHPENYALRDGVAQTMTLFKPRLVTVHRPTCLYYQQQTSSTSKQTSTTTTIRSTKEKPSIVSVVQSQKSSSNDDLCISSDNISVPTQVHSDIEPKPSLIPVPTSVHALASSALSRTSSRESVLSDYSCTSTSSNQQRRPSKLPLPISRCKKTSNSTAPVKNS